MIESPFSPNIKQLKREPLGEVVLHFPQLQGPYAVRTVNLERPIPISTAGSLGTKDIGKKNFKF